MPLVTRTGQVSFAPKGDKGDKGARMRMRVWGASVSYLEGKQGQQFYDIVLYDNLLYLCIRSHTVGFDGNPQTECGFGKNKILGSSTELDFYRHQAVVDREDQGVHD